MIKQISNFVLIPLLTLPSARACDTLQSWQATASASAECGVVQGGGDLMTGADLTALANLAPGNSGAAVTARFGLPQSYCGDRIYYPVATTDPLWIWIDVAASGLTGWGYTTIYPLNPGQP